MSPAYRHLPADFATLAATMTNDALEDHYNAGVAVVKRWREESGVLYQRPAKPLEPLPADFAKVADGQTIAEMRFHYKRSFNTIKRWFAEAAVQIGKQKIQGPTARPMPEGFRDVFADKSIPVLKKLYKASGETVRRWIREAGQVRRIGNPHHHKKAATKHIVKREPKGKVTYLAEAKAARPRPVTVSRKPGNPGIVNRVERDMTRVGQAADFLRKFGGVWRCTPTGSPAPDGTHWRRGSSILTDAEIIERAEYNGWDADAWKRVA